MTHQREHLWKFFNGLTHSRYVFFLPTPFEFRTPYVRDFDMYSSFVQITWNAWVRIERIGSIVADKRAYNLA